MSISHIAPTILVVVAASGCHSKDSTKPQSPKAEQRTLVTFAEESCEALDSSWTRGVIKTAALESDLLLVDATHGGACDGADVQLCGARGVLRTEPGQWFLEFRYRDSSGETCLGDPTLNLQLPISALRRVPSAVSGVRDGRLWLDVP